MLVFLGGNATAADAEGNEEKEFVNYMRAILLKGISAGGSLHHECRGLSLPLERCLSLAVCCVWQIRRAQRPSVLTMKVMSKRNLHEVTRNFSEAKPGRRLERPGQNNTYSDSVCVFGILGGISSVHSTLCASDRHGRDSIVCQHNCFEKRMGLIAEIKFCCAC